MTVPSSPSNGSSVVWLTQLGDLTGVVEFSSAWVAGPEVEPRGGLLVDLDRNRGVTSWIDPS